MNNFFYLTLTLAGCLLAQPLVASANPSELNLSFTYRVNGTLKVDVKFDEPTDTRCIIRHRSSLYYEGNQLGVDRVIRKSSHSRVVRVGRKSTSLRAKGLPGVKQVQDQDPIMAVQSRLICSGSPDITSNVEARFVRCGPGTKRISFSKYFKTLKNKLSKSS